MKEVPQSLRTWFIIHFVIDWLVAIPLFLEPYTVLHFFGWINVDPIAARLVAAALMGIGGASLVHRNASLEVYKSMLALKMLWSFAAIMALTVGTGYPSTPVESIILAIFMFFFVLWTSYYQQID